MLKVTIVTPIYNSFSFLSETIDSVASQSISDWELILVDDCSEDGSYELACDYAKKDSRIRVFRLEKNSGAAVARNTAIKMATG